MSAVDDIVQSIPIDEVAAQLGVDRATAESAIQQALPALLGGLAHEAGDPDRAPSLASALGQHQEDLTEGGVDLSQVDRADGEKIVGHVFGDNTDVVASKLADAHQAGGLSSPMVQKLLAILAPIVMSYITNKILKQGSGGAMDAAPGSGGGINPGGLQDILGDLLGGGGGGLGDLLGGLLGGGQQPPR